MFVEREALRFVFFELTCIAGLLGTEIPEMRGGISWRFNWLTERPNGLLCLFQFLPSLLQAVLQKPGYIFLIVAIERAGCVLVHCSFEAFEEIFVINDVSVVFVIAVQPIHATDSLEQTVVAHLLIYIEIGRWRRV